MSKPHDLPERLLELPMYVMMALQREGYRRALESGVRIRMSHYAVLAVLAQFGPSSQKQIAERLGFDKSDATRIINQLEDQALIQRAEDEADRRRHTVSMTAKGRKQLEARDAELGACMRLFLRGLSSAEYQQLKRLLRKAMQVHDGRFTLARAVGEDDD